MQTKQNEKHHEETFAFEKSFHEKASKTKTTIAEMGNPFDEDSSDLYALDTKEVADNSVKETMAQRVNVGKKQYEDFVKGMTDHNKPSFNEPLAKNKFSLFSQKAKPDPSADKRKIDSLKDDYQLFTRLFISCQSR